MKEKMPSFAFTSKEVATTRAISIKSNASIHELPLILNTSESSVSKTVKSLESKGLVKTRRNGLQKFVEISDANYALSLSEMIKADPYIPWEKLISYSNISVLFSSITGEESFEREISQVSRWRAERNLKMYGMLTIGEENKPSRNRRLIRFINEYSDHVSRKYFLDKLPKDVVILWRSGYRCLFRIHAVREEEKQKTFKGGFLTALSAFPEYGIQFITSDSYYYYDPDLKEITIEDIILHTILIEPDSQTNTTYALLLILKEWNKVNFDLLIMKSSKYGIEANIISILKYIKSHRGKSHRFLPKWSELREKAELYGIVID
ncbi:MAG: winged helix-turn-helix domain-containing protein [Candidatus Thermoplasmatota archaeon]|jgi:DNA-binding transcriptional ArsR family regulator|nr:winged helix-turn-helix domain-containing protein [Candidatus Thermoplasmatota archaeon]MCL5988042.1 winged helix-turn-helix domain-containing protein [Candidatus Thermoplasmatota archaeon]